MKNLISSICFALLLCVGLAGTTAQAADVGDQLKKTPPGLPPQLGDEALGDVGPPIYLPEDEDDPGLGDDSGRIRCAPDITRDGTIGFGDMLEVLFRWGDCSTAKDPGHGGLGGSPSDSGDDAPCTADIDGNGRVDLADLLLVLVNYDKKCGDRDISSFP